MVKEAGVRRWVQTAIMLAWAGSIPTGFRVAHAGQLPEDVHPDSRSRLPPIDREELDLERRETYDVAVRVEGPAPQSADVRPDATAGGQDDPGTVQPGIGTSWYHLNRVRL